MVRYFLFAAIAWVAVAAYGLMGLHQNFHDAVKAASLVAVIVLAVPFAPRSV